ncbi:MAG: sialate O-acetylesterase, partial [Planctomycetes bacterium]|nr:sialate O-acetylesterase [Planctomycetota bacterium]
TQMETAVADAAGTWSVRLGPVGVGAASVLTIRGKNVVEIRDVLVGEVWLGSGQSNMAMTVNGCINRDAEVAAADLPQVRMFTVDRKTAEEPQEDCQGSWQVCSPETVPRFSAAACFFGRELHRQLDVPVGLINSSWGGTPIQGWTSVKAHEAVPELAPMISALQRAIETYDPELAKERYEKQLAERKERQGKAKAEQKAAKRAAPRPPQDPRLAPGSPGRLFNGMIAPLAPYAIRGAIWYQGEANAGGAKLYGLQMKTMIAEWRQLWGQGDFPFLFVQLPNFMAAQQQPSETGGWPLIREQFFRTLSAVPNTGMAVTIDVGEAGDIHPKNKQEVGRRLAQWALAKTYAKDVVASGPLFHSMRKQGDKIVVEFDYSEGLAARDGGALKSFAIAGDDRKFVWADAIIEGGAVVVFNPSVSSPSAVRYAWANNPDCNLVNGAGLAASPFRTDDWDE